jgi:hypothetical protein
MTQAKRKWLLVGGTALAGILIVLVIVLWPFITKTVTVDGTITWLDPETETASFEFIVPWKGEFMELQTAVPDDCVILIGQEKVSMDRIRPGDKATITAKFNKGFKQIIPVKVRIEPEDRPAPLPYWPPPEVAATATAPG